MQIFAAYREQEQPQYIPETTQYTNMYIIMPANVGK